MLYKEHAAWHPAGMDGTPVTQYALLTVTMQTNMVAFCSCVKYLPYLAACHGTSRMCPYAGDLLLSGSELRTLCHFTVPQFVTLPGQHLVLVGSVPALGSWNPSSGVKMVWQAGHNWSAELRLPRQGDIHAKVGILSQNIEWLALVWQLCGSERPRAHATASSTDGDCRSCRPMPGRTWSCSMLVM